MALTDTWLKANNGKQREKTESVADRDGLSVRLSPKGKITFQLRYRFNGQEKRLDLGSYPLMSLKDARLESQRLRSELEQGQDPKTVKLLERQAIVEADTVIELFDKWYDAYCVSNKKNAHQVRRSFELYVFPKIGSLPIEKVTLQDWLTILETKAKDSESIAERLLVNAKQMLKWAVKREMIERNVLFEISAKGDLNVKKYTTDRVLTDEEIRLVWMAINKSRMSPKNKIFIKLCLIYGCRNGELRIAKKSHFDFNKKIWTIPPENHKTGAVSNKSLLRPITDDIEALLLEAMALSGDSEYLFNNEGYDKPMGIAAPVQLPYNIMQWLRRKQKIEMPHWSMHDLRRTARTNFSKLTEPHVAEIMLGHKLLGQWQVYDHYDYLDEQAKAYKKWFEKISKIVD